MMIGGFKKFAKDKNNEYETVRKQHGSDISNYFLSASLVVSYSFLS